MFVEFEIGTEQFTEGSKGTTKLNIELYSINTIKERKTFYDRDDGHKIEHCEITLHDGRRIAIYGYTAAALKERIHRDGEGAVKVEIQERKDK